MNNKNGENLFLESKRCGGALYYHNVYSFYDEPLIFTALNQFEQLFFCYALGCDDDNDRWIIVPVSPEVINELEQKDRSILSVLKPRKNHQVFLARISLADASVDEQLVNIDTLDVLMPRDDIFILENVNYDGKRRHSHRIRIASRKSKQLVSSVINDASRLFGEFFDRFLEKCGISVDSFPVDAVHGSFVFRVMVKPKSKKDVSFQVDGHNALMKLNKQEDFFSVMEDKEIDLRVVKRLFNLVQSKDLQIQLIDEVSTSKILDISPDYVSALMPELDSRLSTYLDSSMVPQADNFETLIKYLGIVASGEPVTEDNFGLVRRQHGYYYDACELLELVDEFSMVTPLGKHALEVKDTPEFFRIMARQFEKTECGYLWMSLEGVSSILEINEESAAEFLIKYCNGLSENTSRRRAQTLKVWVLKFKEHA